MTGEMFSGAGCRRWGAVTGVKDVVDVTSDNNVIKSCVTSALSVIDEICNT